MGSVDGPCRHSLTREWQEVALGLILRIVSLAPDVDMLPKSFMLSTAIPHSGQLNNTTSTLLAWKNPDGDLISKFISVNDRDDFCNVSS